MSELSLVIGAPVMPDDDSSDVTSRQQCVDCGKHSPATETNYTLISARHGWRLTRLVDAAGRNQLQWRCPRCWEIFRRGQAG